MLLLKYYYPRAELKD